MNLFKTFMMTAATLACTVVASAQTQFVLEGSNGDAVEAFNDMTTGTLEIDDIALTLSAFGPDLSDPAAPGPTIPLELSNQDANADAFSRLGIDNPAVAESNSGTTESSLINLDEFLILTLDTNVVFDQIDFFGVSGDEMVNVSIGGINFPFGNNFSAVSDVVNDPFDSQIILEGTEITIELLEPVDGSDNAFGLNSISVTPAAVPEPNSIALLGLGGSLLIARRRRA